MVPAVALLSGSLLLPASVFGAQIPSRDGVIGGVSSTPSALELITEASDASTPTTPGKLRVVENSGICGRCSSLTFRSAVLTIVLDDQRRLQA